MRYSNVVWLVYFISLTIVLISYFVLDTYNGVAFSFTVLAILAFFYAFLLEKENHNDSD